MNGTCEIELRATVLGPSDLYVKSGSTIRIVCRIPQGPHDLGNVFWYKGEYLKGYLQNPADHEFNLN